MRRLGIVLAAIFAGGNVHAGVIDIGGMMGGANVYTLSNFTSHSSDVEGAIVAGGNVNVQNYAVNLNNRDAYDNYAVVAGGNISLSNGSIHNGKTYAGGTTSLTNAQRPESSDTRPVDFVATSAYYLALSAGLAGVDATGMAEAKWGGVQLTGGGKGGVDVFNVSADLFRYSSHWMLDKLTPGQTLIFNVDGSYGSFNEGGISFDPLSTYNVLFNFHNADNVNVRGVIGSVLAPKAAVTADWGVINGNVIVDRWESTIQINSNHYFKAVELDGFELGGGDPAELPEPGSLALMVAGLGMVAYRRRRG